jgi:photosystem II stability/assembly factor-like uncharacterized protein
MPSQHAEYGKLISMAGKLSSAVGRRTVAAMLIGVTFLRPAAASPDTSLDPLDRPAVSMREPQSGPLLAIAAAGARLVAVGADGVIVTSDDRGKRWTQSSTPVGVTLTAVTFATDRVGWAVGHSGVILVTHDAGRTWTRQLDGRSMLAALQNELEPTPKAPTPGAAGSGADSTDPIQQLIDDGPDKPLLAVLALDTHNVLAVGAYGLFLVTNDGGSHWHLRLDLSAATKGKHLYAVRPLGGQLFFAGEAGTLCRSDRLTTPLVPTPSSYSGSFFGLVRTAPGGLIAYGLRGHAMISSDAAQSWRSLDVGTAGSINAGLLLRDGRILLATETGEIRVSTDDGRTFLPVPIPASYSFSDLIETRDGVIAVGSRGIVRIFPDARPQ